MTPDQAVTEVLEKTTLKSGIAARYAVYRNAKPLGFVEAHVDKHGSDLPLDWVITWHLVQQKAGSGLTGASSADLEQLLRPLGTVDLVPAIASVAGFTSSSRPPLG